MNRTGNRIRPLLTTAWRCRYRRKSSKRPGFTMVEQLLTMTVLAITAAISVASGAPLLDSAAVEAAAHEATTLFALARDYAIATGAPTSIRIDQSQQRIIVHTTRDTLAVAHLSRASVRTTGTRDSMAYSPSGLGIGAANLQLTLSRGHRSDTITVSRLGRVRRVRPTQ